MKAEKYLAELLYAHDCVIIPGFGGFVANKVSARVNVLDHSFHPPARVLTFNRNLNNNDGLLVNCISMAEAISFSQALDLVKKRVEEWNKNLASGKKIVLEGIGSLFADRPGNLLFEPDPRANFMASSFGLNVFKSPPVMREPVVKKLEKKIIEKADRIKPVVTEKATGKKKVRAGRVIALAATLALLAGFVWVAWQTNLMEQYGLADLNPFKSLKDVRYTPGEREFTPAGEKDLYEQGFSTNEAASFAEFDITGDGIKRVVDMGKTAAMPDNTHVDNGNSGSKASHYSGKYHLIAGAFAVPSNADNYVIALRSLGLSAAIMDMPGAPLRYVEVGAYDTKEDAVAALGKVRTVKPEIWILVK